jgi:hypothetical protein
MNQAMIKPIQTRYAGYLFRSRLEARWAVFFDALKLKWEYEPEGFELPSGKRYLPDFRIMLRHGPLWVEIKPSGVECPEFDEFMQNNPGGCGTILRGIPDPRHVQETHYYWGDNYEPSMWLGGGADNCYKFCICRSCKEAGFEFEGWSERIGCDCPIHRDNKKDGTANHPLIINALKKARSARFEHEDKESYGDES